MPHGRKIQSAVTFPTLQVERVIEKLGKMGNKKGKLAAQAAEKEALGLGESRCMSNTECFNFCDGFYRCCVTFDRRLHIPYA